MSGLMAERIRFNSSNAGGVDFILPRIRKTADGAYSGDPSLQKDNARERLRFAPLDSTLSYKGIGPLPDLVIETTEYGKKIKLKPLYVKEWESSEREKVPVASRRTA